MSLESEKDLFAETGTEGDRVPDLTVHFLEQDHFQELSFAPRESSESVVGFHDLLLSRSCHLLFYHTKTVPEGCPDKSVFFRQFCLDMSYLGHTSVAKSTHRED